MNGLKQYWPLRMKNLDTGETKEGEIEVGALDEGYGPLVPIPVPDDWERTMIGVGPVVGMIVRRTAENAEGK